jgi:inhibitor of KinA
MHSPRSSPQPSLADPGEGAQSVRFLPAGDTALVIELGDRVDRTISAQVLALSDKVMAATLPGVVETVPTFRSLMVHYDPLITSHAEVKAAVRPFLATLSGTLEKPGRLWVLPTCYDLEFGMDLEETAGRTGLTVASVIELFSATTFHLYMLGFLPGHPYLGDVAPVLNLPRRSIPRVRVPAGSIATAVGLAVIYPLETPGGWHILGRTPVRVYDRRRDPAVFFAPNDELRFPPISRAEYDVLEAKAEAGTLTIAPAVPSTGARPYA